VSGFVHLRVHTEYSLVDSVVRVDPLVESLERQRMAACAITDQGNVSTLVRFHKTAMAHGIKPIVGADVWIAESADDREPSRLGLLCQNRAGFKRLSALLTRARARPDPRPPGDLARLAHGGRARGPHRALRRPGGRARQGLERRGT
jgi:DNA polymerase III alpha subunit